MNRWLEIVMFIGDSKKEADRIAELRSYEILDTAPESNFDDLVLIAASQCEAPISFISLVDENRQWFKASLGLDVKETDRENSLFNHAVKVGEPLIVEDTTKDPRFSLNPLVISEPFIRFYAGFPLISNGHVLGALSVIDTKPRVLSAKNRLILEALARQILNQLQLRVSIKKQTELKLKILGEYKRYLFLVDNLREVVFQTNEDGHWIFLSASWEKIMGHSISDSLGRSYLDFVILEDRTKCEEKFRPRESEKQEYSSQLVRFLTKETKTVWIEIFERKLYSDSGIFIGTTGTLTDVTDQVNQNQKTEDQKLKLIQTARLLALGDMAAGISHEINNPLAIIRASAQMLGRTLMEDKFDKALVKETFEKIDSTVVRIAKIISGLKSIANDGDKGPFLDFSVETIVSDALDLCQTRFRDLGVQVDQIEIPLNLSIECRHVQLSQVILNLLLNAFDAVENSLVKKIRIQTIEKPETVEIKIFDSGPGISSNIKDLIMEPFFTTKGPLKGMGLGLSLSKRIVEAHQGTLKFKQVLDETCFIVCLPKKQSVLDKKD